MPQLFRGHGKGSPGPVHAHQGVDIRRQQRALECGGGLLPNTGALWGGDCHTDPARQTPLDVDFGLAGK